MQIATAMRLLRRDPRLLPFKVLGRVARALPRLAAPASRCRGGVKFEVPAGDDPSLREMAWGIYEPETVRLMRDLLRPGDVFVDVGANLGYLSAVAAGIVGARGEVHAFEPVPAYHERLLALARANPGRRIVATRAALGEREGEASLSVGGERNVGWNTMVEGFMRPGTEAATIRVPVQRLDAYLERHGIRRVALIKIDTEGYELPVLLGLVRFFAAGGRAPILCEVAPAAYSLIGRPLEDLFDYMASFSYRATDPVGRRRTLGPGQIPVTTNVLFDPGKVRGRS